MFYFVPVLNLQLAGRSLFLVFYRILLFFQLNYNGAACSARQKHAATELACAVLFVRVNDEVRRAEVHHVKVGVRRQLAVWQVNLKVSHLCLRWIKVLNHYLNLGEFLLRIKYFADDLLTWMDLNLILVPHFQSNDFSHILRSAYKLAARNLVSYISKFAI